MPATTQKTATLSFGGGGLRTAIFHIGVFKALQEAGFSRTKIGDPNYIHIKANIGISSGALLAQAASQNISLEQICSTIFKKKSAFWKQTQLQYPEKPLAYFSTQRLMSKGLLEKTKNGLNAMSLLSKLISNEAQPANSLASSLLDPKGILDYCNELNQDNDFKKLNTDLYIIATQLNHLKRIVFCSQKKNFDKRTQFVNHISINEAITASSCIPGLFDPYFIPTFHENRSECFFSDGWIADPMGLDIALSIEPDIVILSHGLAPYESTDPTNDGIAGTKMPIQILHNIIQVAGFRCAEKLNQIKIKRELYKQVLKIIKKTKDPALIEEVTKLFQKEAKEPTILQIKPGYTYQKFNNIFWLSTQHRIDIFEDGYNQAKKELKKLT